MNLRQARKKIKTVSNVKKITKAMQLVSAVKMKKAQQDYTEGLPYRETLERMIKTIIKRVSPEMSKLMQQGETNKELIILISSNKGLCGSFNMNLFNFMLKNHPSADGLSKSDFITLGKKGVAILSKFGSTVLADFSGNKPLESISAIFSLILEKFTNDEYNKVSLVYNKFVSAFKVQPVKEVLLPVKIEEKAVEEKTAEQEYTVEPPPELIIDSVLRSFVEEKMRDAVLSSQAGEEAARMMAMKNATDNATDLIFELTMLRNKLRQEKITYELLDMVTAKVSVEEG